MIRQGLLSVDCKENILKTSYRMLEDIGVKFISKEVLDIFDNAGAKVCYETSTVKIPKEMILSAIESTPKEFKMYNKDMTKLYIWGSDEIQFGGGGSVISILDRDGTYRKPNTNDLLKMYKLTDSLEEVTWTAPGSFVSDVPVEISAIWRFYIRLKYGQKPSCADGLDVTDLKDNISLLRVIRPNEDDFIKKPFAIVQPCPMSPLMWTEESSGYLIESAKNNMPSLMIPMPFSGVSSAITMASTIAQGVAENLSGLVLMQIITKGLPVVCSAGSSHADMRSMLNVMGSLEAQMIDSGTIEVINHLGIPSGTGAIFGYTDSKSLDFQAGVESSMGQMLMSQSGVNVVYGMGELAGMDANSLEKIVLDHEVFKYIKRYLKGIDVNDYTLAYDTIKEVVETSSDFMGTDHTFELFKEAYIFTDLFDRRNKGTWESTDRSTSIDKAGVYVDQVLENNTFNMLAPDVDKKLDSVMEDILKRRGFTLSDYIKLLPKQ